MGKQTGIVIGVIIILIVAFIGVKAFKNSSPTQQPTQAQMEKTAMTPSPAESMTASPSATASTSAQTTESVKEFTVVGSNYKFEPNSITVKKGDTVKITFKNSGGFHDFSLGEFHIKTPVIPSGQSVTVQFLADKAGTFQYYCSVGNHRAMGMWGNLIVQ